MSAVARRCCHNSKMPGSPYLSRKNTNQGSVSQLPYQNGQKRSKEKSRFIKEIESGVIISCRRACDEVKAAHLAPVSGRQPGDIGRWSGLRCPRAGACHSRSRAARASACRHYDRRARCSLDGDRTARVTPVEKHEVSAPPVGAAVADRTPRPSLRKPGLGCVKAMSSPLGKSRSGTPEGVRAPESARRALQARLLNCVFRRSASFFLFPSPLWGGVRGGGG